MQKALKMVSARLSLDEGGNLISLSLNYVAFCCCSCDYFILLVCFAFIFKAGKDDERISR